MPAQVLYGNSFTHASDYTVVLALAFLVHSLRSLRAGGLIDDMPDKWLEDVEHIWVDEVVNGYGFNMKDLRLEKMIHGEPELEAVKRIMSRASEEIERVGRRAAKDVLNQYVLSEADRIDVEWIDLTPVLKLLCRVFVILTREGVVDRSRVRRAELLPASICNDPWNPGRA